MIIQNINFNALIITGGATAGCYYLYKKYFKTNPVSDYKDMVLSIPNQISSLSLMDIPITKYIQNGLIISGIGTTIFALGTFQFISSLNRYTFQLYGVSVDIYKCNIVDGIMNLLCYSPMIIIEAGGLMLTGTLCFVLTSVLYPLLKIPLIPLIPAFSFILPSLSYNIVDLYMPRETFMGIELSNGIIYPIIGIFVGSIMFDLIRHLGYNIANKYSIDSCYQQPLKLTIDDKPKIVD